MSLHPIRLLACLYCDWRVKPKTTDLWVRVSYRARDDGWVLTANKRGPTLVPAEDLAAAGAEFDAQEAAFASAAAAASASEGVGDTPTVDSSDRPLTGAKPPALGVEGGEEDRPLTGGGGGGGGKGAWVPPSEFPDGQDEGPPASVDGAGGKEAGGANKVTAEEWEEGDDGGEEKKGFMMALG